MIIGVRSEAGIKKVKDFAGTNGMELVVLSPRVHYNHLLTDISHQMSRLFLLGFIFMAIYLFFVQKSLFKVLYICIPLVISFAAFVLVCRNKLSGPTTPSAF